MHKLLLVFVTFACCRLSAYECPTTNIRIQSKLFVKTNNNDVAPPTLSPSPPPKTIIYPPKTGIRLNKALTSVHSRRAADRLIEEGRVKINGSLPLGRGDKVDPAIDIVTVDGEVVLVAEARDTQFVYIKFYKPVSLTQSPLVLRKMRILAMGLAKWLRVHQPSAAESRAQRRRGGLEVSPRHKSKLFHTSKTSKIT